VACQPAKMEAALLLLSHIPSERVDRYLSLSLWEGNTDVQLENRCTDDCTEGSNSTPRQ